MASSILIGGCCFVLLRFETITLTIICCFGHKCLTLQIDMNEMECITSVRNPKIVGLLELSQKSSARRKSGLFVVEGRRELNQCIQAGYEVETLFVCPELYQDALKVKGDVAQFHVSPYVYEKIAYRGSTEGVVAIVRQKSHTLKDLALTKNPLIVVLESVEKPGNLGAILRSADAAGVTAVVVCDPLTDLYNPNIIRGSIGAIFTVPTIACTSEECIKYLQENNIQILTAQLQDSNLYYDVDMMQPTAVVMGTESTGLTNQWREAANHHIRIPMLGKLDSLNVSVSAAILMYEAVRQRKA